MKEKFPLSPRRRLTTSCIFNVLCVFGVKRLGEQAPLVTCGMNSCCANSDN